MLSHEDNLLLMQTDASKPMGKLMRRYWIPFLFARELVADGGQQRVLLLGERLISFRDTLGRVGLVDEFCAHRRASLYYGRNEECGIRCSYHGLKFDVNGKCLEAPTSSPGFNFEAKVKIKAYPVREAGGLLWTYMGPPGTESEIPDFEWMNLHESHLYWSRWIQEANWFGAIEGEVDSSHVAFAHGRLDQVKVEDKSHIFGGYVAQDRNPRLSVERKTYGLETASARTAEDGQVYWRINHFLVPFYTMITSHIGGHVTARMWVPADDENTLAFTLTYRCDRPLNADEIRQFETGEVGHPILTPGSLRPRANRDNDYLMDREVQKKIHFTGIATVRAQDAALTESAGAMPDRTKETLAASDVGIVAARRLMLHLAKDMESGQPPAALDHIADYATRPISVLLPAGTDYRQSPEVARGLKPVPGVAHNNPKETV